MSTYIKDIENGVFENYCALIMCCFHNISIDRALKIMNAKTSNIKEEKDDKYSKEQFEHVKELMINTNKSPTEISEITKVDKLTIDNWRGSKGWKRPKK